jgi:hypothetical protein
MMMSSAVNIITSSMVCNKYFVLGSSCSRLYVNLWSERLNMFCF